MKSKTTTCKNCEGSKGRGLVCYAKESPRYLRFIKPLETCTTWKGIAKGAVFSALLFALIMCAGIVEGHTNVDVVYDAIKTLSPHIDDDWARELAPIFLDAGEEHNFDPNLLVAITYRESAFSQEIASGRRRGDAGEIGLMQTLGAALRHRPAGCSAELNSPQCQIRTGAAWLSRAREACGGPWESWVYAYKYGRCAHDFVTMHDRSVRNASRYYSLVLGEEE